MSQADDKKRIESLLEERVGYVRFGKKDRVKAVDAELERLGWEDPEKAKKPEPEPEKQEPKGRAGRESRQTTADDKAPKATA
jgi:hypothetical protein